MKPSLLLLDDDESTRNFITTAFVNEFTIHSYPLNSSDPVELIRRHHPACVLIDSFELCKRIKSDPSLSDYPVLLVSSKNRPSDVSEGLALGADDLVVKPFDRKELLQRIQVLLKKMDQARKGQSIRVGGLEIDTVERTAKFNNQPMNLTITEFDILRLLASKPGIVISREEIMRQIWKDSAEETTDRTIDVHIRSLRKKTPEITAHIKSVYGVGYRFEV